MNISLRAGRPQDSRGTAALLAGKETMTDRVETDRVEMVQNAAGRMVPGMVNGKPAIPYLGMGKYQPRGRKAAPPVRSSKDYPEGGDKRVADLETALRKCGLRDGMVISNHHHLRDGDRVALMMLEAAARIGVKDVMWFPSASFPSQKSAIDLMQSGVIHHIEGSMNGPLGDYCTQGKMRGMGVLRSHGGRWQAIQDGEVHIDIAVIAAPRPTHLAMLMARMGSRHAAHWDLRWPIRFMPISVIVVTDNLVPFPCMPWQIQGNNVDYVVEVESIGDPAKIVSGTTQITRSPDRLRVADMWRDFCAMRESCAMGSRFRRERVESRWRLWTICGA